MVNAARKFHIEFQFQFLILPKELSQENVTLFKDFSDPQYSDM